MRQYKGITMYNSKIKNSFFVFASLLLISVNTILLLNSPTSVLANSVLFIYHGRAYIVTREESMLLYNGESVVDAVVVVKLEAVNQELAEVVVEINGTRVLLFEYSPETGAAGRIIRCSGEEIISLINNCRSSTGMVTQVPQGPFSLSLVFTVNTSNNYAWLGGKFVGFFPLYVFPDVRYENASNVRAVYLDDELRLKTVYGKPAIARIHYHGENGTVITFKSINFHNKYVDMLLVHHYPVHLHVLLPIGNNTYLLALLEPDQSMYDRILAVNDYPEAVSYINYAAIGSAIAVGGAIAAVVYFGVKSLRKRR